MLNSNNPVILKCKQVVITCQLVTLGMSSQVKVASIVWLLVDEAESVSLMLFMVNVLEEHPESHCAGAV